MTEKPESSKEADGKTASAEKSDAENARRNRIIALLETMVDGPLPQPQSLHEFPGPVIPDFGTAVSIPSRQELADRQGRHKRVRDGLESGQPRGTVVRHPAPGERSELAPVDTSPRENSTRSIPPESP